MKRCLFTYKEFETEGDYSLEGLKELHGKLTKLSIFPYDHKEQMEEVLGYHGKISIQGVQPKLSAKLSLKNTAFEITDVGGTYILKPQVQNYEQLPENEDLTMHLASMANLTVPWHGLLKAKDGSLVYAIKRFDRLGKGTKLLQEDFAQLIEATRDTKYQADMERVADVIKKYCTFPKLENPKLLKLLLFSFLVGNEDLHLKNFSLQTNLDRTVKLTPAYDLVNSTIIQPKATEELALQLNGKKQGLKKEDFISYYAVDCLDMSEKQAIKILTDLLESAKKFPEMIERSFLNDKMKEKYINLLSFRIKKLT